MAARWLLASWCALGLAGCAGDPLFLMFDQRLETPAGEQPVGSGCESIGDGSSGSGVAGPAGSSSFSVEHEGHGDDGVRVLVRDGRGQIRAVRNYNDEFLLSDEVDEFSVELDAENTLHLRYWGGLTCEPVASE
jgi:hypothetical protein